MMFRRYRNGQAEPPDPGCLRQKQLRNLPLHRDTKPAVKQICVLIPLATNRQQEEAVASNLG